MLDLYSTAPPRETCATPCTDYTGPSRQHEAPGSSYICPEGKNLDHDRSEAWNFLVTPLEVRFDPNVTSDRDVVAAAPPPTPEPLSSAMALRSTASRMTTLAVLWLATTIRSTCTSHSFTPGETPRQESVKARRRFYERGYLYHFFLPQTYSSDRTRHLLNRGTTTQNQPLDVSVSQYQNP